MLFRTSLLAGGGSAFIYSFCILNSSCILATGEESNLLILLLGVISDPVGRFKLSLERFRFCYVTLFGVLYKYCSSVSLFFASLKSKFSLYCLATKMK